MRAKGVAGARAVDFVRQSAQFLTSAHSPTRLSHSLARQQHPRSISHLAVLSRERARAQQQPSFSNEPFPVPLPRFSYLLPRHTPAMKTPPHPTKSPSSQYALMPLNPFASVLQKQCEVNRKRGGDHGSINPTKHPLSSRSLHTLQPSKPSIRFKAPPRCTSNCKRS